jgi:hypothetical protein
MGVEGRVKACGRLATYPWFAVEGVEPFQSGGAGIRDWEAAVREQVANTWPAQVPANIQAATLLAVDFQTEIGCTHIILPAPLISEREDEGESAGIWLDAGIAAAGDLDIPLPLLATVAVSESALNQTAFQQGGLIEAIADQITARAGVLEGVYVVVVQTHRPCHPFDTPLAVSRAYVELTKAFASVGLTEVVLNFADLVGLVGCGVGATGFATGPSHGLRTLHIEGFQDEGGGLALPHYYSHRTSGEYLSETDLDRLVESRAFRRVIDRTSFSAPLVDHLLNGGSARNLPAWAESQNNQAAQRHFLQRVIEEGRRLRRTRLVSDRRDAVVDWLESAQANTLFVAERVGGRRPPPGRHAHAAEWLSLLTSSE